MQIRASSVVLILANLVPLAGVLLLDWQVFDLLILYWVENVVIGGLNVARMAVTRERDKWFLMPFFAVHYGLFCFAHLTAIMTIFDPSGGADAAWGLFFGQPAAEAMRSPLWIAAGAIAASHLFSFFGNFIAGGEYRRTSAGELMTRPYGRIVVLHLAVIFGAALIQWLGNPVAMLLVLIAGKTALDLKLHGSEREIFSMDKAAPGTARLQP
jgi:hypothetical protein